MYKTLHRFHLSMRMQWQILHKCFQMCTNVHTVCHKLHKIHFIYPSGRLCAQALFLTPKSQKLPYRELITALYASHLHIIFICMFPSRHVILCIDTVEHCLCQYNSSAKHYFLNQYLNIHKTRGKIG